MNHMMENVLEETCLLTFPFENLWHPVSAEFENELQSALFTKLNWTHIRHLLRVTDLEVREWYIKESVRFNLKQGTNHE